MAARRIILLLYFLSGSSALIYQVVWVRLIGEAIGHTTYSAAVVTSVFMGGLGVGSYVAGRRIDRVPVNDAKRPLVLYGWIEVAIAVGGLLLSALLPTLAHWVPAGEYSVGHNGWWHPSLSARLSVYGIVVVLIAPMSLLMGSTLTLLVRYTLSDGLKEAGWRIGLLYGLNTAGAAAGAFFTDFALVPRFGLFNTQLVAVGFNLLAGAGALVASRPRCSHADHAPPRDLVPGPVAVDRGVRAVALALFCSGFAAMAVEIIWFRHLISILGAYRTIFSLMMTVLLVGLWLGSIAGGVLDRWTHRPMAGFVVVQSLFIVSVLGLLLLGDRDLYVAAVESAAADHLSSSATGQRWLEVGAALHVIVLVVGLPSIFMGFAFPLANAQVQRVMGAIGRRAGGLYLANTIGNVLGALVAGFVMLPLMGVQQSVVMAAAVAALGLLPIVYVSDDATIRRTLTACFPVILTALTAWSFLPPDFLLKASTPALQADKSQIVTWSEGVSETLAVEEIYGERMRLMTNGHSMSSTGMSAQRYMRAMVHLPLLLLDSPTDVFVMCFGVGNSLHAASLHPTVERMHVVDTSANVLRHASYFAHTNDDVLEDGRVKVVVDDGRHFLRTQPLDRFDLITLEPPPITFAGVSSLYSQEFYQLARSRIRDGGFVSQWLPIYQVPAPVALSIVRTFVDVFPNAVLLSGSWTELVLLGRKDRPITFAPDEIAARLKQAGAVQDDMRRISMGDRIQMAGSFLSGPRALDEATRGAAPITDDSPLLEYAFATRMQRTALPLQLFRPRSVADWCPECAQLPAEERTALLAYVDVLAEIYRSSAFREFSSFGEHRAKKTPLPLPLGEPPYRAVVDASLFLQSWVSQSGWLDQRSGS